MPIKGFSSECGYNDAVVVSKDKHGKSKHVAVTNGCGVTQYQVDGNLITEGKRCDYLVINETDFIAFLIELKGSDLCKAALQLEESVSKIEQMLDGKYDLRFRIVANKCKVQEIETAAFKKYRIKWGKKLIYKTETLSESIHKD